MNFFFFFFWGGEERGGVGGEGGLELVIFSTKNPNPKSKKKIKVRGIIRGNKVGESE